LEYTFVQFISFDVNKQELCVGKIRMHVKRIKTIVAVNYFMCAVKFNVICELK